MTGGGQAAGAEGAGGVLAATGLAPLEGELLQRRWRRGTLREVYRHDDGTVTKRYWRRPGERLRQRPWAREHAALTRLAGDGMPCSYGFVERELAGGHEVRFRRDFIAGVAPSPESASDVRDLAGLLARVHAAGVVIDDAALGNFIRAPGGAMQCIDYGRAIVFARRSPRYLVAIGNELAKFGREVLMGRPEHWLPFLEAYRAKHALGPWQWGLVRVGLWSARATRHGRKTSAVARWLRRRSDGDLDNVRCGRYPGGRFWIRRDSAHAVRVETFIVNGEYRSIEDAEPMATRNKRYRLCRFVPDWDRRPHVMKASWTNPAYPAARRFNIFLSHRFKNHGRRAMAGAMRLEAAGVRTIRPLASWRVSGWDRRSYLLYAMVSADFAVSHYRINAMKLPPDEHRAAFLGLLEQLALMLRRIHDAGLRYDDMATGNFLVQEVDGRREITVIDTDNVFAGAWRGGWLKPFFDMKDLRRLELRGADRERFLAVYLGREPTRGWRRIDRYWSDGWYRPWQRLRHRVSGRRGRE